MSVASVTLLWVQAGSALWLAFVLQFVYRRVYREQFLHFWSLSFGLLGLTLMAHLAVLPPSAKEIVSSQLLYLLGLPQFSLVVLAAVSVKFPRISLRRQVLWFVGTMAVMLVVYLLTIGALSGSLRLAETLRFERLVWNVVTGVWFCAAFWKTHYLARTVGGQITILFTALRAVSQAAEAGTIAGVPFYPDTHSVISVALGVIMPFGIAAGMIMLAAQAMTTRTHELRESEERYRTLVESSPDAIIATDPSGMILTCNLRAAQLLGHENAAELIGKAHEDLIAPKHRDTVRQTIGAANREDRPASIECQILRCDGSLRYADLTAAPRGTNGTGGNVTILQDITERKEAEAVRMRLESQLLQSQKLDSIGRLAGGVAHDFNNQLTVIQGCCEIVLSSLNSDDPRRETMESIRQASEQSATLTRQLLAFGRKQIMSPKPVSLNDVVSSMKRMLRRLVPESIEINTIFAPGLGAVMADVGQIEQVLMNLAVNARDAMPDGGKILIETANVQMDAVPPERQLEMRPGAYVMLAVTDTGIGMDERTRALAFEPFYTTKESGKGTGLGLATVYGIVKQSGGSILVYSEPSHGTTFKIYLPRVDAEPEAVPGAPASIGIQPGTGTVLVVEDQAAVRGLISSILQSCGYRIIEASGPSEALALPDSDLNSIDLLVTDVVMPGLSGKELASRLTVRKKQLNVLFISGYTPNAIAHHGILDPDVHFLQKPFTAVQISAKVSEILSRGNPASKVQS